MSRMRRFLLLAAAAAWLSVHVAGAQTAPRPRLVLVLSIDQMRFDYLTRFAPLYKGGLRTLLDRGAVFTNARYRHSATETGPGHSVILTGRHPSHSGIVANDWFDAARGAVVNVVDDPAVTPLGGPGRRASPMHLLSPTVGDLLKAANPRSRVVGVSVKDRSAILMAGQRADAAYWYEAEGGNFVTSSYYMTAPPGWLTNWNRARVADRYAGQTWTRLLPDVSLYERYAGADASEGESDRKDIVFPHALLGMPPETGYYANLRPTPFADELTLTFALEAMTSHTIGVDPDTDILAIGFSGTDYVGHTYGADSQEVMDQLLRLDLILDRLFKDVDARVGLANTLVVLTSDHGSLPLVELLKSKGVDARRVAPAVLRNAVEQAFATRFPGATDLIRNFSAPDFYLDEPAIERRGLARQDVEDAAATALLATGLVERVYTQEDLKRPAPPSDPFFSLFQNTLYESRSPHLNVLLKPWTYANTYPGGTGHGTAHDYDRHVPVVFMGPRIKGGSYGAASGPEDIAPTLASLLGLPLAPEPDARLLSEMLRTD